MLRRKKGKRCRKGRKKRTGAEGGKGKSKGGDQAVRWLTAPSKEGLQRGTGQNKRPNVNPCKRERRWQKAKAATTHIILNLRD